MYQITINGKQTPVYEHSEWKTSISEDFKPGDLLSGGIAWDLINALPPAIQFSDYFQVGEPYSHRPDKNGKYRPTFCTMRKVSREPEVWQYLGNCFLYEQEEPEMTIKETGDIKCQH